MDVSKKYQIQQHQIIVKSTRNVICRDSSFELYTHSENTHHIVSLLDGLSLTFQIFRQYALFAIQWEGCIIPSDINLTLLAVTAPWKIIKISKTSIISLRFFFPIFLELLYTVDRYVFYIFYYSFDIIIWNLWFLLFRIRDKDHF